MSTLMRLEALEASHVVSKQIEENQNLFEELSQFLNQKNPYSTISIARGSSDHAAQYLNFLITHRLGKLTTSFSMSAITLYGADLDTSKSAAFAISQSGQSPDIVKPMEYFNTRNCPTISMVNDQQSPLATTSQWTIPLLAGPEKSVAATKSFIASLSTSAMAIAHWGKNQELIKAINHLPDDLLKATQIDWSPAITKLINAKRIMVVGRGYGLSLALESALKFKETCGIQAEAFSAAEIKHGPMALVEEGYPIFIYANRGPALHTLLDLAQDLKQRGASIILAAPSFVKEKDLEIQSTHIDELDILTSIQSFYLMAEQLSRELGRNPDVPKNLNKVTKTH